MNETTKQKVELRAIKRQIANAPNASLRYTGIDSHPGLTHVGLYDTVVALE